jgi:hypothetical protein
MISGRQQTPLSFSDTNMQAMSVSNPMTGRSEIERKIEGLDLGLFSRVSSQSSAGDKTSWLALQRAIRSAKEEYVYLEIGSHLGGSIQQFLVDPKCRLIYSIDKRPLVQPDDRGRDYFYPGNSSERMLENLRPIDVQQTKKICCIDSDVKDIDRSLIERPPDLCFIDGEHTTEAVLRDFEFCRSVSAEDATFYFHDDQIVFSAISEIIGRLSREGTQFVPLKLGGRTFAIALGASPVLADQRVRSMQRNHKAYLMLMRARWLARRLVPSPLRPGMAWIERRLGFGS